MQNGHWNWWAHDQSLMLWRAHCGPSIGWLNQSSVAFVWAWFLSCSFMIHVWWIANQIVCPFHRLCAFSILTFRLLHTCDYLGGFCIPRIQPVGFVLMAWGRSITRNHHQIHHAASSPFKCGYDWTSHIAGCCWWFSWFLRTWRSHHHLSWLTSSNQMLRSSLLRMVSPAC